MINNNITKVIVKIFIISGDLLISIIPPKIPRIN